MHAGYVGGLPCSKALMSPHIFPATCTCRCNCKGNFDLESQILDHSKGLDAWPTFDTTLKTLSSQLKECTKNAEIACKALLHRILIGVLAFVPLETCTRINRHVKKSCFIAMRICVIRHDNENNDDGWPRAHLGSGPDHP